MIYENNPFMDTNNASKNLIELEVHWNHIKSISAQRSTSWCQDQLSIAQALLENRKASRCWPTLTRAHPNLRPHASESFTFCPSLIKVSAFNSTISQEVRSFVKFPANNFNTAALPNRTPCRRLSLRTNTALKRSEPILPLPQGAQDEAPVVVCLYGFCNDIGRYMKKSC